MPVDKYQIEVELAKIVDPEINVSIMELNLVDKVEVHEDGRVEVQYHATTPYCPAFFALQISQDIKERLSKLEGVKEVNVVLTGHYMAEYINRLVAEGKL
jgi:metal-sulfur cluster biosynthetic enzyme